MSLDLEKEQAVQALCAHYAQEHLSTQELESRFERVYRSTSRRELDTVLEGLPALQRLAAPAAPMYQVATTSGALPPGEKRYLAVFSGVTKEGAWTPSPLILAKAIMGSVILDFREVELPPHGVDIDVDVIMGECKILLPPGVGAEVDASAFMGSVVDKAQRALPGAPVIRVRGGTIMGEISVITKLPKPARLESWRKQLKQLLGGDSDGSSSSWGF